MQETVHTLHGKLAPTKPRLPKFWSVKAYYYSSSRNPQKNRRGTVLEGIKIGKRLTKRLVTKGRLKQFCGCRLLLTNK